MRVSGCVRCGQEFDAPHAPCPDGREGCLVAHFAADAYVCPRCKHDNGPAIGRAIREGRAITGIGIGIGNPRAIRSLKIA